MVVGKKFGAGIGLTVVGAGAHFGLGRVAPVATSKEEQRVSWICPKVEDPRKNDLMISRVMNFDYLNFEPAQRSVEQWCTSARGRPADTIKLVSA